MVRRFTLVLVLFTVVAHFLCTALATERPIIGILTQEVSASAPVDSHSQIVASYVKAVEQSGARVVPIFINKTESYYRNVLDAVNGVLFPGGGLYFTNTGGFADTGRIVMDYAKEVNSNGDNFPILGVCLGMELMLYLEVNNYSILGSCNSDNVALPLMFKDKFERSRLYYRAPKRVIEILRTPMMYNHHKRCVTEQLIAQHNLTERWRVLSTSFDLDRQEFISSIELRGSPIAGIQFHPEKNAYEWNPTQMSVHTHKAVYSARYFYDWLVNEARRNNHYFQNSTDERESLIYNYVPTIIKGGAGYYQQVYYFT